MNSGIVTITVDDAHKVVVNILNAEGRVVEAHNVGQRFKDEQLFHAERDNALEELEKATRRGDSARDRVEVLEAELNHMRQEMAQVELREARVRLAHIKSAERVQELEKQLKGHWEDKERDTRALNDCDLKIRLLMADLADRIKERDEARQNRVDVGQQVYLLDTTLADDLNALLKNCKPGPITLEPRGPEWLPITTALKDESHILVYEHLRGVLHVAWSKACENWCIIGSDDFSIPTHWMPLPEPPR